MRTDAISSSTIGAGHNFFDDFRFDAVIMVEGANLRPLTKAINDQLATPE